MNGRVAFGHDLQWDQVGSISSFMENIFQKMCLARAECIISETTSILNSPRRRVTQGEAEPR